MLIETCKQKRRDIAIEWTLGLVIPVIVAGPICECPHVKSPRHGDANHEQDYVVQDYRFVMNEGFGCINSSDGSILSVLLIYSWSIIPPLVSIVVYYRKLIQLVCDTISLTRASIPARVIRILYRQSREINHYLRSNSSVSRTNYIRILALASIDVIITLPLGVAAIILNVRQSLSLGPIPFYSGWTYSHTDWDPETLSYAEIVAQGPSVVAQVYFNLWSSPVLSFIIFGLFGVTAEARASYWKVICTVGEWFGWKPIPRTRKVHSPLGEIEFGKRTLPDMSLGLEYVSFAVIAIL